MSAPRRKKEVPSHFTVIEPHVDIIEDAHGYSEPYDSAQNISHGIMMQLPSANCDGLDSDYKSIKRTMSSRYSYHERSATVKRKESKYLTMTLKRMAGNSENMADNVDKVYELLTADPDTEAREIKQSLRDMHQNLTLKRMVKAKLDDDQAEKKKYLPVNCWTKCKYKLALTWQKMRREISELSHVFELWHNDIKRVQGHFGSSVASYFIFLRWLLYLNIFNFLLLFGFIVCPQFIYEYSSNNITDFRNANITFSAYDLITGSNWLQDTVFYYGHYTSKIINIVENFTYHMPLAYLFTIIVLAVINLIIVARSVTKSYQTSYIATSGEIKNVFCNKVFCSWDFTIETSDAATLRRNCIYHELKELLYSQAREEKQESLFVKVGKIFVCILVNIFVVSVTIATGYLVYFILENKAVEVDVKVLDKMTLALTVTAITITFYYFISYATKLEHFFSKQVRLYLTMARVVALRIVVLAVLIYFWMIKYSPEPGDINTCYETLLGEEIYRLIIVNFFMNLIFCTLIGEYSRKVINKYVCSFIQLPEYDVAYNTIDIIYYQTLTWVGVFFSPLLPFLMIVILVLLFYLKFSSAKINHRPSQKAWSASQAHTIFLILAFANLMLAMIAIGYSIFSIKPSSICGSFRNHNNTYEVINDLFEVSIEQKFFGAKSVMSQFLHYAGSPPVLLALILGLSVSVYFSRARSKAHEKIVKLVREQLILEGKDKVFLLRLLQSAYEAKIKAESVSDASKNYSSNYAGESTRMQSGDNFHNNNEIELLNEIFKDYHNSEINNPTSSSSLCS